MRHPGLWEESSDVSRGPPEAILEFFPEEPIMNSLVELWSEITHWRECPEVDPFPDYHADQVFFS